MKARNKVEIGTDMETDMIKVRIRGQVDGMIPRSSSGKLDAILNNNILEYDEKIKGIQELINAG